MIRRATNFSDVHYLLVHGTGDGMVSNVENMIIDDDECMMS